MQRIDTIAALEAYYGTPVAASVVKVTDRLSPSYRRLIEAAPFAVLATVAPEGLDASPRGDKPGFVRIVDDKTLILPDRRGNNRIDSLRNVVRDPRVALLFMIPGSGNTLRVNGRAFLTADSELLASFAVEGQAPRTAMVVEIIEVYFQCARAILRSGLWNPESCVDRAVLPTAGDMLAELSAGEIGGPDYDAAWPKRAATSMW
jgi:PPOX class probable FMN-dependent enzyme